MARASSRRPMWSSRSREWLKCGRAASGVVFAVRRAGERDMVVPTAARSAKTSISDPQTAQSVHSPESPTIAATCCWHAGHHIGGGYRPFGGET